MAGQGTPSLSPTPSPAGSVGSVGSQSSGYSSGELAGRSNNTALQTSGSGSAALLVPLTVFNAMSKQNQHVTYLLSYQELWEQADSQVINGSNKGRCLFLLSL